MLITCRKVGEEIVIDGNITVKIVDINGRRVSVGIEAPPEVKITRPDAKRLDAEKR